MGGLASASYTRFVRRSLTYAYLSRHRNTLASLLGSTQGYNATFLPGSKTAHWGGAMEQAGDLLADPLQRGDLA